MCSTRDGVNKGHPCTHKLHFAGPLFSCSQRKMAFSSTELAQDKQKGGKCEHRPSLLPQEGPMGLGRSGNSPCLMREQEITFPEHSQGVSSREKDLPYTRLLQLWPRSFLQGPTPLCFSKLDLVSVELHESMWQRREGGDCPMAHGHAVLSKQFLQKAAEFTLSMGPLGYNSLKIM